MWPNPSDRAPRNPAGRAPAAAPARAPAQALDLAHSLAKPETQPDRRRAALTPELAQEESGQFFVYPPSK